MPTTGPVNPLGAPLTVTVSEAVRLSSICRTNLYAAMSPDPAKRRGLPHLPSFAFGRRRLIRFKALKAWLAKVERDSNS